KTALFFRSHSQEAPLRFSKSHRQVVGSLVGKQAFLMRFLFGKSLSLLRSRPLLNEQTQNIGWS
ncbi:hypothetical protein AB7W95_20905, partial [Providencia rettgeri]